MDEGFIALGTLTGKLHLVDLQGHRLLPDVVLGEGPILSFFFHQLKSALSILSASGELFIWKISSGSNFDVEELFAGSITKLIDDNAIAAAELDADLGVVHKIELSDDNLPIVIMRSGNVYKFHRSLRQWLLIVDAKAIHAEVRIAEYIVQRTWRL